MKRNRMVEEYVMKHRLLRQEMIFNGCLEVLNEKRESKIIKNILNGMKRNCSWPAFLVSLKLTRDEMKPKTIEYLEEMMIYN